MDYLFKLTSSMEKIFFDKPDKLPELKKASILKNEIFSFQLAAFSNKSDTIHDYVKFEIVSQQLQDLLAFVMMIICLQLLL